MEKKLIFFIIGGVTATIFVVILLTGLFYFEVINFDNNNDFKDNIIEVDDQGFSIEGEELQICSNNGYELMLQILEGYNFDEQEEDVIVFDSYATPHKTTSFDAFKYECDAGKIMYLEIRPHPNNTFLDNVKKATIGQFGSEGQVMWNTKFQEGFWGEIPKSEEDLATDVYSGPVLYADLEGIEINYDLPVLINLNKKDNSDCWIVLYASGEGCGQI